MANFSVFWDADIAIQIHTLSALTALTITPWVLWRQKRDRLHKIAGYVWTTALVSTSFSAFAISNFPILGPFSPLHLLAILALWSVYTAIRSVLAGNITKHERIMRSLATYALGLPMVFNFLPERTFARAFFSENWLHGFLFISTITAIIWIWRIYANTRRKKPYPAKASFD